MLPLISISVGYAQKQEGKQVEKFVEMAKEAKERLDEFIDTIEGSDELTELYEGGVKALEDAEAARDAHDYGLAIEKAKEAMDAFREVFKQLNTLLEEEEEAEVEEVEEDDVDTLTEAIKRARARIERVGNLIEENEEYLSDYAEDELDGLLDDAEDYLKAAEDALEEEPPEVSTAAHNLGEANRLISQAFVALKKASGAIHSGKLKGFLTVISKFYERVERLVERAKERGIDVGEYEDELEDIEVDLFAEAKDMETEFEDAVAYLMEARMRLEKIQDEIRESMKGGPEGD